jgi:hypothetical protein
MGCGCKRKNQQVAPPEPAAVELTEVNVYPVELTSTPTDLTEEQKEQVDKIVQKIEDLS